jgi:hypothetical protein
MAVRRQAAQSQSRGAFLRDRSWQALQVEQLVDLPADGAR